MDGYSGKTITKDTYANYDTIDITSPWLIWEKK